MTTPTRDEALEGLLTYLSTSRNFDFTAYKRPSLARRIQKRIDAVGVSGYAEYMDYLQVHPDEFSALFDTILINVTRFFRDAPTWEYLQEHVIPGILERTGDNNLIRIWCAGVSSGEEAYSVAMLFAESLGEEAFRRRVKIYATDVDEDALDTARQAVYNAKDLAGVSPERVERFFERVNGNFAFRKDLRRSVIFGRHDLLSDAPISRVHLLVCRNTLMYLNSEAQGRVLSRMYFALANGGFLFLGKAETLFTHTSALMAVDLQLRFFQKVSLATERERANGDDGSVRAAPLPATQFRLRDIAFDVDPVAQVMVDAAGLVAGINERARTMFGLRPTDISRPLQDVELSYRPIELRSLIEQAYTENRTVTLREVPWLNAGVTRWLDVAVLPLVREDGSIAGASVVFTDVTRYRELRQALEQSKNELETAYEELQSTNEELETTNEELQSTIEELETTNEELQSTNEELETMNEELQSTNEELETVNQEMRVRGGQLNNANSFLGSILTSLQVGVVVLDRELAITAWKERAQDLWGLRADEVVGRHFLNLDIGLPVDELTQALRQCLSSADGRHELSLQATNRRGKAITCQVTCMPLRSSNGVAGVVVLMDEVSGA